MQWLDLTEPINEGLFKLRQVGIGGQGVTENGDPITFAINAWMHYVVVGVRNTTTDEVRYYGVEGAALLEAALMEKDIPVMPRMEMP